MPTRQSSCRLRAAFFAECVDMEARSYVGSLPLKPWLEQIDSIHSTESLFAVLGRMHAFGMPPMWTIVINTDAINPDAYQAEMMVSGLGLPSDSLYMLPPPGLNEVALGASNREGAQTAPPTADPQHRTPHLSPGTGVPWPHRVDARARGRHRPRRRAHRHRAGARPAPTPVTQPREPRAKTPEP